MKYNMCAYISECRYIIYNDNRNLKQINFINLDIMLKRHGYTINN